MGCFRSYAAINKLRVSADLRTGRRRQSGLSCLSAFAASSARLGDISVDYLKARREKHHPEHIHTTTESKLRTSRTAARGARRAFPLPQHRRRVSEYSPIFQQITCVAPADIAVLVTPPQRRGQQGQVHHADQANEDHKATRVLRTEVRDNFRLFNSRSLETSQRISFEARDRML